MDINKIENEIVRKLWQEAKWVGKPSRFYPKVILTWLAVALSLIAIGILLYIFVDLTGLDLVLLILFIGLAIPFFIVGFVAHQGAIYAVKEDGIYFTSLVFIKNKATWFTAEFSDIYKCKIKYSISKKRATFTFLFKDRCDAGMMGMIDRLIFRNIIQPKALLSVIKAYNMECEEK